jgi:hypothetical protein
MSGNDPRSGLWLAVTLHNTGAVALAAAVLWAYGYAPPPDLPTADQQPVTIDYGMQIVETATPTIRQ